VKHKLIAGVDTDIYNPENNRFNIVVKSNQLIQQSRFDLSTQQQKIVLYIISQIEPNDEEFKLYQFKITDFCAVCGIEPKGDMYNMLKNAIQNIVNKSIWITLPNGKETTVKWIEKPYIDRNSGTIEIKLDNDMKPYLLKLKEKFTEYELIYTLNFKSKYSIRLYEYLKSIHYNKLKEYTTIMSIDEFQKILNSTYADFKDFHTRVLKPAFKEINQYSDINFSYDIIKNGRKATDIRLIISTKEVIERIETASEISKELQSRRKRKV
jgi:plasmid replication initiation protein